MSNIHHPHLGSYGDLLEKYSGADIFFDNLPFGNNGDLLIEMGSRHVHRKFGLRYVTEPRHADLLIVRGNGSFVEGDDAVLKIVLGYAADHPDIPLCVEPSSFLYHELQLNPLIRGRTAPLYLFARDEVSFRYLLRQRGAAIEVGLDHDLALSLRDSSLIAKLRPMDVDKILVVERMDIEHPFRSKPHFKAALRAYRSIVPKRVRGIAKPLVNRLRSHAPSRIRKEAAALLDARFPELTHLPRVFEDVSDRATHDFESFLGTIATSAVVVTSRLHPGILAAMLGKPTILLVGEYPKIRAIYDHSLRGFDDVFLQSVVSEDRHST